MNPIRSRRPLARPSLRRRRVLRRTVVRGELRRRVSGSAARIGLGAVRRVLSVGRRPDRAGGILQLPAVRARCGWKAACACGATFYARLPAAHSDECRALGGVAQLIMEAAARELNDCDAWFAYIGDERSMRVCTRVGYRPTGRQYVAVKWFRSVSAGTAGRAHRPSRGARTVLKEQGPQASRALDCKRTVAYVPSVLTVSPLRFG